MKNKAFTLLELLGVVIILGVLSLITFPIILNQIKNAKQGIKDSAKALIIDAAKDYYEDNINNYDLIEGMTYCINVQTLTDNNYLNKNLKNENLNNIDTSKKVKLIYHNNKFNYEITDTCNNNSLTRNNIEVKVVTEGKGLYKAQGEPDRFIYRGGEPNNYIWLDENGDSNKVSDELYRIISFENDGTIKVMRNENIGGMAWDTKNTRIADNGNTYCTYGSSSGCNAWSNEEYTLKNGKALKDLNRNFYYESYVTNTDTTLTPFKKGTVLNESTLNINLNSIWYNNLSYKNYIEMHSFNVGSIGYWKDYSSNGASDKGIEKEKYEESLLTWNGYIGLINLTEYVEASTNPACTSVYSNFKWNPDNFISGMQEGEEYVPKYSTDEWPCNTLDENNNPIDNWMYKKNERVWTISAYYKSTRYIWYVEKIGMFVGNAADKSYGIFPAFYLKASTTLKGEGTEANPYRIVGES